MLLCDLTLSSPPENLALDEALLETCEEMDHGEVLRFWEPKQYFVVVGYANSVATEVNVRFCEQNSLPILRRCSGGGTVLQGPGCLNYSLIVRIEESGPFSTIHTTNQEIMERHRLTISDLLGTSVEMRGHTDLAIKGVKFSGNAQRRKRKYLIFHGTFLLNLDLALVEEALRMPSKQPDYRLNRSHSEFLVNLGVRPAPLKECLMKSWSARETMTDVPIERATALVRAKYGNDEWNRRF